MSTLRFSSGGLEVRVDSPQADGLSCLSPTYREYPPTRPTPDVVVTVSCDRGFLGRRADAPYPGFSAKEAETPGVIELWRHDAAGRVTIPTDASSPVKADFTVTAPNLVEAPIRIAMCVALPRVGGLLLHSSAVCFDGRALVFAGKSGAGKSTIADLLSEAPDRLKLADELIVLRRQEGGDRAGWYAYVSPYQGPDAVAHGEVRPVAALHFLAQAPEHRRTSITPTEALQQLLPNVLVYVSEPATARNVLSAAVDLVSTVPCYALEFRNSADVASVLEHG